MSPSVRIAMLASALLAAGASLTACAARPADATEPDRGAHAFEPEAGALGPATDGGATSRGVPGTTGDAARSAATAVATAPPARDVAEDPVPAPVAPRELALPHGWDTSKPAAFEEALARWNPGTQPGHLDAESLSELGRAVDGPTPRALRAVLLLAHARAPEASAALLARLERRIRSGADAYPAVDVAAAAALARATDAERAARAAALDELARGNRPHPLLPVRAECAASALALGRDALAPFLLALLREGTEAQDARPAWTRGETSFDDLELAQWRASEALAARARIVNPYRPESSAANRAAAALQIERALAAPHVAAPRGS